MAKYSKPFEGDYELTSPFGPRDLDGDGRTDGKFEFHDGVDFDCPENTSLYAFKGGIVEYAGVVDYAEPTSPNMGILIKTADKNYWTYFHMNEVSVKTGEEIATGQYVGKSGMTGWCYGAHLHFGIYLKQPWRNPTNPATYFGDWDKPSTFIANDESQTNTNTQTEDDMIKVKLISAINARNAFNQNDKDALISAVNNNDMDYVLSYGGSEPRTWLGSTQAELASWKQYACNILFGNDTEKDQVFTGENSDIAFNISNNKVRELAYSVKEARAKSISDVKIKEIQDNAVTNYLKNNNLVVKPVLIEPKPIIETPALVNQVPHDVIKQPNTSVVDDLQILAQKNIENLSGVKFDPSQVSMTKSFIFDRLSSLTSTRFFGSIGGSWLITTFGPDQTRNITAVFAIVILYIVSETIVRVQKNRK
jgi:hypothetical protein